MKCRGLVAAAVAATMLSTQPGFASTGASRFAKHEPQESAGQSIERFYGISNMFHQLRKSMDSAGKDGARRAALWQDFHEVACAVLGEQAKNHSYEDFSAAFGKGKQLRFENTQEIGRRDELARLLNGLGYSAREISDMLTGRISKGALDNAQKMRMLGYTDDLVSAYLAANYAYPLKTRKNTAQARNANRIASSRFDAYARQTAALHGVRPELVRAVIKCESDWNPRALSSKGAIGLMQLMPGTAHELGVNPYDPAQNIDGGVRYLAYLVKTFGSEELGLIGYIAGEGFIRRYVSGKASLYGEIQDYVNNVARAMRRI